MIVIKSFYPILCLGLIIFTFLACSSTTSSTRYNDSGKNSDKKGKDYGRYQTNSASDDSLIVFEDGDFPESEDPGDLPDDESQIDISAVIKNLDKNREEESLPLSTKKDLMIMEIIKYMNTPYKFGGNSLNGIDCSAFTQSVFKNSWLLDLNRSAREQFTQGIPIENRSDLKFGDLVFFNTRRRVKPGHVGIYIGENLFAHASTKLGVTISSLEHDYYNKRYMGARRIEEDEE
ncbi:MAG: NlpC/P60 family protein [Ignavibacterium sp.]|jgi:cell wall-associated NlpC family hydrolase|nr:NlpC/P60 family protein [Ignavibacterium sp.]